MKLETFYAELFRRTGIFDQFAQRDVKDVVEAIDAMTGGALFRGVEKIAEDWEWPK